MTSNDSESNPLHLLRDQVDDDTAMDPRAAERLESALRVAHATRPDPARPPVPRFAAALLVLLALAGAVALTLRSESPSSALILTDASNVIVELPDGALVVDPADGFSLPEGSVVVVGESGMVTIGDVVIDEPTRLAVRENRLVTDVAVTRTADPPPEDLLEEPRADDREPEEVPVTTSSVAPPTDSERRDSDGERTDSTKQSAPATVKVGLDVRLVDAGASLRWSVMGAAEGWNAVVYRIVDDRVSEVLTVEIQDTDVRDEFIDPIPTGDGGVGYRLVIFDDSGREVAAGPTQTLRLR